MNCKEVLNKGLLYQVRIAQLLNTTMICHCLHWTCITLGRTREYTISGANVANQSSRISHKTTGTLIFEIK